jgi:hypothetical protein
LRRVGGKAGRTPTPSYIWTEAESKLIFVGTLHRSLVANGVLEEEADELLSGWFEIESDVLHTHLKGKLGSIQRLKKRFRTGK